MFKPVDPKVNFPNLEEEILKYWKKNKIFEKSVESRPADKRWTFLDGPPFVTGVPHYGSLLSSIPKDLFGRYWTMKGYRVRRVWGWDGHGLPIENKVEGKLGVVRKKDIEEKIGVGKFIEECKKYVNEVSEEWEWYVDHIGRWSDFKNAYKTWSLDYMESVMWVFKNMYEKGFIYKGLIVTQYCPHCATPISNFEVAMDADNYREMSDPATIYKYKLEGEENTYILAWSTTPWNKIVTTALAVNPKLSYVKVSQNDEQYILTKSRLDMLEGEYKIIKELKGTELIGKKFEPHYDYYRKKAKGKLFEIIGGDFVTADEGTGVVTIAAYGEEDLKAMQEQGVHIEMHLDDEGTIFSDVPEFGGMYYLKANKAVNEDLKDRGLVYSDKEEKHNVALCWRCHTRLYYSPITAWYVDVQKLKPLLKKTNEDVNWFPEHFKTGRFLKSLESAPDWNISRNRYWGSPVPVWECDCGEKFVPGSIQELEDASGEKITDLHKPQIDEVFVDCKKCGKKVKRVSEVLDSWIEAGSASFAERHFPFDPSTHSVNSGQAGSGQAEKLDDFYPPDFIAEYTGQIRAWFYVLHVIGGALYETKAFKNVVVEGVILGTDGRKMSKNYGNYPDPKELIKTYGGDALRLYLMGSPVMHGEDIVISEEQYRNQVKGMMLVLWNIYNFFVSYALLDKWKYDGNDKFVSNNVLDKWILSFLNRLIKDVTESLDKYDTVLAISKINNFINDLSTWYIRRSRDRAGSGSENTEDKEAFYNTSYTVLIVLSMLLAPIAPFISEEIYRNLTDEESVHLQDFPKSEEVLINSSLEDEMNLARQIVEGIHSKRKEAGVKVRQPLGKVKIKNSKINIKNEILEIIKAETNIKNIDIQEGRGKLQIDLDTEITQELQREGEARDIARKIQEERKRLGTKIDEKVDVELPEWPKEFEEYIKKRGFVAHLTKGTEFKLKLNG
ncbi:MAG: isoleucine--tRNA ligase [Patescibacteria group bacterium]